MNADGAEPHELFKEMVIRTVYPAWSPDGKQVLFGGAGGDGRVQVCICNSTGDGFAQLTHDARQCSYAAWSPDGQYIAYVAFERWPYGYSPWEANLDTECPPGNLMLYDTLSGEHRKLLTGELPMYGPRRVGNRRSSSSRIPRPWVKDEHTGKELRDIYLKPVSAIGELPVRLQIDREADRLHGAIAHHKLTATGMGATEVSYAIEVPGVRIVLRGAVLVF